jgi:hypoxanthine-guanine phosphoribosyltransferase
VDFSRKVLINIANKTIKITFRVTPKEYEKIEKKAQKSKMNISQYVSLSALGRDIVIIEDLKDLTHQLSKVGTNLNQVTMLAHQGKVKAVDLSSVKKVVEEIWQLLNSLTEKTKRTGR